MRRGLFERRTTEAAGPGAIDLAEEAVHLVRLAPARTLAAYYVGTLPFVLGLLYFFADMAYAGDAAARCGAGALALTGLYVWMKCWQAVYCQGLRAYAAQDTPASWTWGRLLRMGVRQAILQSTALVALPAALVVVAPYAWMHAFYYSVNALDGGDVESPRALAERAWAQARLWPMQNHLLIWLLSPGLLVLCAALYLGVLPVIEVAGSAWAEQMAWLYAVILLLALVPLSPLGIVLSLNMAIAIGMIPMLLRTLFGVETFFSLNASVLMSSMFAAVVCGLAYLALDPLMRAAYVLRCFYGESLETGEDLRVALRSARNGARNDGARRARRTGALVLLAVAAGLCAGPGQAQAETPSAGRAIAPMELDEAIDAVLQQREYLWRLPREYVAQGEEGPFSQFMMGVAETVREWVDAAGDRVAGFIRWIRELFGSARPGMGGGGADWGRTVTALGVGLLALAALLTVVLALRLWRRSRFEQVEAIATEDAAAVDLEDEEVSAADLPEDRWVGLAEDLARRGEYRLALRALFLAGLARLDTLGLIRLARGKTNRDYLAELARRGGDRPQAAEAFRRCIRLFEGVWYGTREANAELLEQLGGEQRRMTDGSAE